MPETFIKQLASAPSSVHAQQPPRFSTPNFPDLPHLPIRFVLIGHPRCGSTLLVRALRCHPNIRMYGEAFHESPEERSAFLPHGEPPWRTGTNPERYLRRTLFRQRWHRPMVAVGFKLFYHQARVDRLEQRLWSYLGSEKRIRVVHLQRRNLFEALVSLELAKATGRWAVNSGDRPDPSPMPRLTLSPEACLASFRGVERGRRNVEQCFTPERVLNLEYDADILWEFTSGFRKILDFLGLPPARARVRLVRQRTASIESIVTNYRELQDFFKDTPYSAFFGSAVSSPVATGKTR